MSLQKLIAKAYQATDATSAAFGDRPGSTTVTSDMRSNFLNQRWKNNKLKCQKKAHTINHRSRHRVRLAQKT